MALDEKIQQAIHRAGAEFLAKKRPPEPIRKELDLIYRIEGQSVLVYEVRPRWNNPSEIMEEPVAKTTFIKAHNHWKVFWMRADLKWHSFPPKPIVKTIDHFFQLVVEDEHYCFFG